MAQTLKVPHSHGADEVVVLKYDEDSERYSQGKGANINVTIDDVSKDGSVVEKKHSHKTGTP